ncbi:MAG: helix-turn-helix transcriptional regulator [Betaproteobacteria bacterium]
MPNIGTILKEEIVRLSRRESRSQIDPTRKATAQMRRAVATLKRQVAQLERQVAMLSRKVLGAKPAALKVDANARPTRFSAKGLQAQRSRVALSAGDFGKLMGVSAQSIYNWESAKARPRPEQIAKLAAFRALGKREVAARLARLTE